MSEYPAPEGAPGTCGFCHPSHFGRSCGTEDRPLEIMSIQKWKNGPPLGLIQKGHTTFLIRGTADPESSAIPVVVVPAKPMTDEEMAISHSAVGLSYILLYDVQGDGNDFEERRMWELREALWKART